MCGKTILVPLNRHFSGEKNIPLLNHLWTSKMYFPPKISLSDSFRRFKNLFSHSNGDRSLAVQFSQQIIDATRHSLQTRNVRRDGQPSKQKKKKENMRFKIYDE
ncbi:hypothetical protein CEXT_577411 [Caerostris extrusa]|uniref:Uncharacterized protein n=1 Tax=Caerostris extrusa TaxID=172846 RepID=A0AAV4RKH0_CAEEX|nr:hypothetical protein CEXT_577411 [Caerostris extrusa]